MDEPTLTRHDDGTLTVAWPDPPRRTYEVAHEALQSLVDDYNEVVLELRRHRDIAECAEACLATDFADLTREQAVARTDALADALSRLDGGGDDA